VNSKPFFILENGFFVAFFPTFDVLTALPGSLARQPCPAALPGSLARQPCRNITSLITGRRPAGSLARQPCRNITSLLTGRRPAELQAILRHTAGSLVLKLSPQLTRHCDFELCTVYKLIRERGFLLKFLCSNILPTALVPTLDTYDF
jgi:hypothetical protein